MESNSGAIQMITFNQNVWHYLGDNGRKLHSNCNYCKIAAMLEIEFWALRIGGGAVYILVILQKKFRSLQILL